MVIVLEADEVAASFRFICGDLLANSWEVALEAVTNRPGACALTLPGSATDILKNKLQIAHLCSPAEGGSPT